MDRLDAMQVFVTAVDEGSLAGAARRLKRSAPAVSRAIAFLEQQLATPLLHRTTRTIRLSAAGEQYAAMCRRVLADLQEADILAAGENAGPTGVLTLSAPTIAGEEILQPVVDAYLAAYPLVSVRIMLVERRVNLIDEGVDLALRVGELADSAMVAVRVGANVRRMVVAAPRYLALHPRITEPRDLAQHQIVAQANFGLDRWIFQPSDGSTVPRTVMFAPRIVVNSVRAALASAVQGMGVTRLYDYHVAKHVTAGALEVVLAHAEPPHAPVHLVVQPARVNVPKVRAFLDFAVPRLRAEFARMAGEAQHMR